MPSAVQRSKGGLLNFDEEQQSVLSQKKDKYIEEKERQAGTFSLHLTSSNAVLNNE